MKFILKKQNKKNIFTLVMELLIFLRQRASNSLDSSAHCIQVVGGCRYLHERQMYIQLLCLLGVKLKPNYYRPHKQTFHIVCRSAPWLAWGFPQRCPPECADRAHTCWQGWEGWGCHRCSTGWGGNRFLVNWASSITCTDNVIIEQWLYT